MQANLSRLRLAAYQPDLLVQLARNVSSAYEFYRARELIELGRERMRAALEVVAIQGRVKRNPFALMPIVQIHLQRQGLVVLLIARAIQQRDAVPFGLHDQRPPEAGELIQLARISVTETFPARRIVPKPFTQRGRGCQLFGPDIERGVFLLHAARPKSIDQHAITIGLGWPVRRCV